MRVLDRYFLSELLSPFGFGVALFTLFLLLDRIYHLAELVITNGVPFYLVLQLLLLMLPSFLAQTLPMALLIAILLAGGRLAGDLEIIAFKAAGVSVLRLFRPALFAALVVTVATASLTLVVNPLANEEFQRQLFRILEANVVSGLQERVFNTKFGDVVIYVETVSASRVALRGMLVSDERDPKISRIITAREGRLLTDHANRRITLRLFNGAVNEADIAPAVPASLASGDSATVGGGAADASRYRYTRFDIYDMSLSLRSALKSGARFDKPETNLGLTALVRRIEELASEPYGRVPYLVELHKRFAFPVAAIVFAIIAFPLAVRSHRGGRSIALAGSLVLLVSYYLIMTSLEGMALSQRIPAWIAIWLPNTVFAVCGLALLIATAWEWRPPRVPLAWSIIEAVKARLPRRHGDRDHVAAAGGRNSTHILDRYLMREFFIFVGIGLGVAATLFVVVDLLQTLDRYLRVKPPLIFIFEHFLYRLPAALYGGLPVIMLVATIFLFLALSRFHELTAMKAAGISLYRASAPILLVGMSIAVTALMFQELFLPRLNELGEEVDRVKVRGQLPRHLQSQQRLWLRSGDTRFYRVELLAPASNDMYGVTMMEIDKQFRLHDRLDARQAHWTPEGWQLQDGAFREVLAGGNVETVPFMLTTLELGDDIDEFTRFQKPVELMSYVELRDYVNKLQAAGLQAKRYLVDLYSKLSFPLVNLVMVLVAIPLSLQSPRSGRLFGVALSIAIMAGYLVIHYAALAFARANLLPPLIAAWTANIIFFGIGSSLFLRART